MKELLLIFSILLGSLQGNNYTIVCEVVPLEWYGFVPLYEDIYDERVCKNIIDYTDFTIVHIDELEDVENGSILKVEVNNDNEVVSMEKIIKNADELKNKLGRE